MKEACGRPGPRPACPRASGNRAPAEVASEAFRRRRPAGSPDLHRGVGPLPPQAAVHRDRAIGRTSVACRRLPACSAASRDSAPHPASTPAGCWSLSEDLAARHHHCRYRGLVDRRRSSMRWQTWSAAASSSSTTCTCGTPTPAAARSDRRPRSAGRRACLPAHQFGTFADRAVQAVVVMTAAFPWGTVRRRRSWLVRPCSASCSARAQAHLGLAVGSVRAARHQLLRRAGRGRLSTFGYETLQACSKTGAIGELLLPNVLGSVVVASPGGLARLPAGGRPLSQSPG